MHFGGAMFFTDYSMSAPELARALEVEMKNKIEAMPGGQEVLPPERAMVTDGVMRSSLEILRRMANGIDPFDHNRFKAACAALPHESPRLSLNLTGNVSDFMEYKRERTRRAIEEENRRNGR
jgi:cytochrome c556